MTEKYSIGTLPEGVSMFFHQTFTKEEFENNFFNPLFFPMKMNGEDGFGYPLLKADQEAGVAILRHDHDCDFFNKRLQLFRSDIAIYVRYYDDATESVVYDLHGLKNSRSYSLDQLGEIIDCIQLQD